jgi:hypothetical protein
MFMTMHRVLTRPYCCCCCRAEVGPSEDVSNMTANDILADASLLLLLLLQG